MAALGARNYVLQWQDGQSERTALYALRNVNTGDTVELADQFSVVKRAVILGTTLAGSAVVSTIATSVVTIPGGSSDAAYLLVFGVAA